MATVDTDYLIVGAGAAAMAFADSLVAESDADVVMVDRRESPGGHWNDAYPFVRLHQPSAFYGVNSRILGRDAIDDTGPNAGFYDRATGAEVCEYFQRVLDEHLLASGQVRFFGLCEYRGDWSGEHRYVARDTGEATTVTVRRKVVDATYLETSVPATHTPSFDVDVDARLISVNDLVASTEPGSRYTIIGAGKTAMDACAWLLDNGVTPEAIRWIRPRDPWLINRATTQPLERVAALVEGVSFQLEAAAQAESVADLFRRLEASGQLLRLDPEVEPTMFRCATVSRDEVDSLRRIEDVVRLGRVIRIGGDRIVFEDGSVATDAGQVHVDCTAEGLRIGPPRPIFEPRRITLQQIRTCQPTFNAALVAFVESARADDADKNSLCPPNPYPSAAVDWLAATLIAERARLAWSQQPDIVAWSERSRLNAARGIVEHIDEPEMQSALGRLLTNSGPAIDNLEALIAANELIGRASSDPPVAGLGE